MKKILLFIIVLFCTLSYNSMAQGCSAAVCTCPGGGSVLTGQYCPTTGGGSNTKGRSVEEMFGKVWQSFAYDESTGAYGIGFAEKKGDSVAKALNKCKLNGGTMCKNLVTGNNLSSPRAVVVYSSNNVLVKGTGDGVSSTTSASGAPIKDPDKLLIKLLKECQKKGGTDCKLFWETEFTSVDYFRAHPEKYE